MRILLALGIILAAIMAAHADQTVQRTTYGMSLSMQGQLLDLNAPICSPAAGSYSVAYRNSIATGCATRSSDDFATLVFAGGSTATYTMPQSKVSTFTGSISGTTLTTPANAVVIGSVITGTGVLDNTYVTASTNSTTWTVNNSQTVGSETLTQSVYAPGHGTCFANNGTALLTLAATTSTIYGAAGVVNGNPAVTGGQVVLFPQGEACLQADTNNNYKVSGFIAGSWFQSAAPGNSVGSFQWTGLSGYPRLHLSCSGIEAVATPDFMVINLAYGGTFQTTGYTYQYQTNYVGMTVPPVAANFGSSTTDTKFIVLGTLTTNINNGAKLDVDFSFGFGTGMGWSNDIESNGRYFDNSTNAETWIHTSGVAPLTTTQPVTGIKISPSAGGNLSGMCWLTPRT